MPGRQSAPAREGRAGARPAATAATRVRLSLFGILACVVVGLAYGLRVYHLADANIWFDEGFSIWIASGGPLETASRTLHDTHPPLYYWVLWAWSLVAGDTAFALRWLSAAAGTLAVAVLYGAGRSRRGGWFALLAAFFLATSRFAIDWSQQVRMYEPALLLVVVVFGLWWRLLARGEVEINRPVGAAVPSGRTVGFTSGSRAWAPWIAYSMSVIALGYTLYLALLVPLSLAAVSAVWLARRRLTSGYRNGWLLAHGIAGVLLSPWLLLVLTQGSRPRLTSIALPGIAAYFEAAVSSLWLGVSADLGRVKYAALVLAVVTLAGFVWALCQRQYRAAALAATLLTVGPPVLLFALSQPNPFLVLPNLFVRYLVIFVPFACLGLAWALFGIGRLSRPLALAAGIGILALNGWVVRDYFQGRYLTDDYQPIIAAIDAYAKPGDQIVLYSDKEFPVFFAQYDGGLPVHRLGTEQKLTPELAAGQASAIFHQSPTAWVITVDEGKDSDPDGHFRRWLQENARDLYHLPVQNRSVNLYSIDPAERRTAVQSFAPDVTLRQTLSPVWELTGYDQPLRRVARGDALRLGIYLRATAPTPDVPVLEVELVDAHGTTYRSVRQPLAGDWFAPFATGQVVRGTFELRIFDGIPGADYQVRARLVDPNSPAPAPTHLGSVTILSDEGRGPQPVPQTIVDAPPSEGIQLFGYEGVAAPTANGTLSLDLFWRVIHATPLDLQSYLRFIGLDSAPSPGNPVWAADYQPSPGGRSTQTWVPNEVILESRQLNLPNNLPPGRYRLEAGLFDPAAQREAGLPVVLWEGTIGAP